MRRFLLTVAAAATALTGTACGDSTGLGSNPAGSYELRTINGQSLPVQVGGLIYEGGVLELDSDGEFVEILEFREPGDPLSTQRPFPGFWEREGSDEIRLEYDDGTTLFARRQSSSRIVIEDNNGNDWSYQRF
jgi:hypothetical protein